MKNLIRVAKEKKKTTILTVLMATVFFATYFIEQNEIYGLISQGIIRWVAFGVSLISGVVAYVNTKMPPNPRRGNIGGQ